MTTSQEQKQWMVGRGKGDATVYFAGWDEDDKATWTDKFEEGHRFTEWRILQRDLEALRDRTSNRKGRTYTPGIKTINLQKRNRAKNGS